MPDPSVIPQIRTSERVLFKRCKRAWWWAYREGLKPKRVSNPLWFGELAHVALALWYCGPGTKRGPHPAETFKSLATDEMRMIKTKAATDEEIAQWTDLRDLGITLLEEYVKEYGRDERWLVIAPEQTFTFDIPWPEWWGKDTRALLARNVGTFDLVYRDADTGWLWLGEHKTAKSVRTDHLPLDEQGGTYWVMAYRVLLKAGLIKKDERLHGIMYNFLRKGLPDLRPRDAQGYATNKPIKKDYIEALADGEIYTAENLAKMKLDQLEAVAASVPTTVLGERSKLQPSPLFVRHPVPRTRAEQRSQLIRIQDDAATMEVYRRGELPITKTPHWSCARLCDFYDMCRLEETSGNWKDLRSVAYRVVDPYADHRKSTEEIASFEL